MDAAAARAEPKLRRISTPPERMQPFSMDIFSALPDAKDRGEE
jgi:hypothetical protein